MSVNLPLDEKLQADINRRRIAEELRKQRIFNAKLRQIGVDTDALNYQIHEKILNRAKEAEQERCFSERNKNQNHVAQLLEKEKHDEVKELNKKIDEFRLSQQKPQYRREYDLYDPHQLKKEHPPRINDNDPCPLSGLQKFEGEDLNYKWRAKKQKEQMRDLLLQQMQEKRIQNYTLNNKIQSWESSLLQQDYFAGQLSKEENEQMRQVATEVRDSNKRLFLEMQERKLQQKIDAEIENRKDIEYNFYGDLLSENPDVARSAFGPHRVVPDRWKGMSKQQLEEYYEGQLQQIRDKKRKEQQQQHEEAKWSEQIQNNDKNALLLDKEEKQQKGVENKNVASKNCELAQQQKLQQHYMDKVVYTNIPSENYFTQFNTTSR